MTNDNEIDLDETQGPVSVLGIFTEELKRREDLYNEGQHGRFWSTGKQLIDLEFMMMPLELGHGRRVEIYDTGDRIAIDAIAKPRFTRRERITVAIATTLGLGTGAALLTYLIHYAHKHPIQ